MEEPKLQQMYNSFLSKVCQLDIDSSPFFCLHDFMKSFCSVMPWLTLLSLCLRIHKENGMKLRKIVIKLLIKHNLWPFPSGQLPVQLVGRWAVRVSGRLPSAMLPFPSVSDVNGQQQLRSTRTLQDPSLSQGQSGLAVLSKYTFVSLLPLAETTRI